MFRVLTQRRKSRLTSPRFVAGSIAAHLVAALLVVGVSNAEPAPVPVDTTEIDFFPVDPPAKDPEEPTPVKPAPPMREGDTRELPAPRHVPDGIEEEDPEVKPVDPREFSGLGTVGDTVVSNPRPAPPTQPPGDGPPAQYPDYGNDPLPSDAVDVRPALANGAEAARLLQRYYPAIYADAGVAGQTVVEIIVERNGRVRPGSARIVSTTHEQFGDAALRLVERFRFRPARVADQPVVVSVQVPIEWRPVP